VGGVQLSQEVTVKLYSFIVLEPGGSMRLGFTGENQAILNENNADLNVLYKDKQWQIKRKERYIEKRSITKYSKN